MPSTVQGMAALNLLNPSQGALGGGDSQRRADMGCNGLQITTRASTQPGVLHWASASLC